MAAVEALSTISISTYPNGVTGQCYADSEFFPSEIVFRNVNTSAFTGTGKFAITLMAAPGQGIPSGNALAYNQNATTYNPANGVCLNFNQPSYPITGGAITVANTGVAGTTVVSGNILISGLQIKLNTGNYAVYTDNNTPAGSGPIVVRGCLIDDFAGGTPLFTGTVTTVQNCLVIIRGSQDPSFCPHGCVFDGPAGVGGHFYGCTIVNLSDNTGGSFGHPENACTNTSGEGAPGPLNTSTFHNCAVYGFTQVSDVGGSGTNPGMTYSSCMTDSPATTTNTHCTETNSPNVGPGMTAAQNYANSFVGTTNAAANFRLKTGSPLLGAGAADATNLSVDIYGNPRPSTGSIDIGCHQFTAPSLLLTVNGSTTPAAVSSLYYVGISVVGVPPGDGPIISLQDTGNATTYTSLDGGNPSPATVTGQMLMNQLDGVSNVSPLPAGNYHINLYLHSNPSALVQQIPIAVTAYANPPLSGANGIDNPNSSMLAVMIADAATGGTRHAPLTEGERPQGYVLSGPISATVAWVVPSAGGSGGAAPRNVTMQYYLVDSALTYHPLGVPVFGATTSPSVASFDSTTLPDDTYIMTAKVIDINDTTNNWVASEISVMGAPVIIQNGVTPINIAVSRKVPSCYYPNNFRNLSGGIDSLNFAGVSASTPAQGAAASPYPIANVLPVYDSSSPYNAAPVNARTASFWWENVNGHWVNEYKTTMEWRTTNAGGIFAQPFVGKTIASNNIEGSYPAIAQGSYRDGGRNSNFTTNFVSMGAVPTGGPFAAGQPFNGYHWHIIQEDGRLAIMDLAGNMLTIGGYRRDLTVLPIDWLDGGNAEFPTHVQVGGIDPTALYTFADFGGGAADACWDPRDPYICYVTQTVDHCIIKLNFHTQTVGGVNYGVTAGPGGSPFPLCQRYAGYKGGLGGVGGYADGVALVASGSGGAQFNGVYSLCMMKRTDNSTYPQGTMFVADNYNGLIRVISAGTLDSNGNQATPSTVSTLLGRNGTQFPTSAAVTNNQAWMAVLSGMTTIVPTTLSASAGVITVASPIPTPVGGVGWKVVLGTLPITGAADATFTGSISGKTLTISGLAGSLGPGNRLAATGLAAGTCIVSIGDAVGNATANTYQVNISQTLTSTAFQAWGSTNVGGPSGSGAWSAYTGGSGGAVPIETGQAIYTVASFTNNQNFTLTGASVPGTGAVVVIPSADTYSSPVAVPFSSAIVSYPSTMIRMASKGHLVISETWYNQMQRVAWLSGPNANTVTRIGPFGNLAQLTGASSNNVFGFSDVDDAVTSSAGTFTDPGIGACGPQDEIVLARVDVSALGSAADADRWAFDKTFNYMTTYDGNGFHGDGPPDFPAEGVAGVGHYPWGFAFSKTQFRMLSCGLDPLGFIQWRPRTGSDPDGSTDPLVGATQANTTLTRTPGGFNVFDQGNHIFWNGTRNVLPCGFRPSFSAQFGFMGSHLYGAGTGPTIDELPGLHPTYASLAGYLQNGAFGSVPRPELSVFDDTGTVPARPMALLYAFMHRASMAGSWPTQDGPVFYNADTRTGNACLVTNGSYSLDYIRPQITVQAGDPTRVSNTSIRVRWTTTKATIGLVLVGTPNSNHTNSEGKLQIYSLWTTFEMDNSGVYGTTHDVTITGLPDKTVTPPSGSNAPNNVAVYVFDRAGNWSQSANFVVS